MSLWGRFGCIWIDLGSSRGLAWNRSGVDPAPMSGKLATPADRAHSRTRAKMVFASMVYLLPMSWSLHSPPTVVASRRKRGTMLFLERMETDAQNKVADRRPPVVDRRASVVRCPYRSSSVDVGSARPPPPPAPPLPAGAAGRGDVGEPGAGPSEPATTLFITAKLPTSKLAGEVGAEDAGGGDGGGGGWGG